MCSAGPQTHDAGGLRRSAGALHRAAWCLCRDDHENFGLGGGKGEGEGEGEGEGGGGRAKRSPNLGGLSTGFYRLLPWTPSDDTPSSAPDQALLARL